MSKYLGAALFVKYAIFVITSCFGGGRVGDSDLVVMIMMIISSSYILYLFILYKNHSQSLIPEIRT